MCKKWAVDVEKNQYTVNGINALPKEWGLIVDALTSFFPSGFFFFICFKLFNGSMPKSNMCVLVVRWFAFHISTFIHPIHNFIRPWQWLSIFITFDHAFFTPGEWKKKWFMNNWELQSQKVDLNIITSQHCWIDIDFHSKNWRERFNKWKRPDTVF